MSSPSSAHSRTTTRTESPLLSLSPELQLSIISHLPLSDLQLTCQQFSNLLALDVAYELLKIAQRSQTILIEAEKDGADKGAKRERSKGKSAKVKDDRGLGKPFIIMNVRKDNLSSLDSTSTSNSAANTSSADPATDSATNSATATTSTQDHPTLLLEIYHPPFLRNDEVRFQNPYDYINIKFEPSRALSEAWVIKISLGDLSLVKNGISPSQLKSKSKFKSISLTPSSTPLPQLVEVSAALLRRRFTCPECSGAREVCPGCGGFSTR